MSIAPIANPMPASAAAPRQLGDFQPSPIISDQADEISVLDQQVTQYEAVNDGGASAAPDDQRRALRDRMMAQFDQFEGALGALIQNCTKAMKDARQQLGIDYHYNLEETKYRCEDKPALLANGEIDKTAPHAEKKAGVTIGLFIDACTGAIPVLADFVLGRGEDPYVLANTGSRSENPRKTKMLMQLLNRQREDADWNNVIRASLEELPRHGTAIIRQMWEDEIELVPDDLDFTITREVKRRKGMQVKLWPLLDTFVSKPLARGAAAQDTVVWASNVTAADLAANELVVEMKDSLVIGPNGEEIPVQIPYACGRFFGLEAVRRMEALRVDQMFTNRTNTAGQNTQPESRVTASATFELLELQGRLPVGAMLRSGRLTIEMLNWYGVELKDDQGPLTGEAAARLADRLCWYASAIMPNEANGKSMLVELRKCPYRRPRNELLVATYIRDGNKFYGLSANRIGADVGDTADKVLNDIAMILDNNADPVTVFAAQAFGDEQKVRQAMKAGEPLIARGGLNAKEAVSYLLKPYDPQLPFLAQMLIGIYTTRTMVSQSAKGASADTQTHTFGELQSQISQGERRLSDIARAAASDLVARSMSLALEDLDWFLSDDELIEMASRVCGVLGIESVGIWPTARGEDGRRENLRSEYIVRHAGNSVVNKDVGAQMLIALLPLAVGIPSAKPQAYLDNAVSSIGFNPDDFKMSDEPPTSPNVELQMIIAGDYPVPDPREDAMLHAQMHQQQLMGLEQLRIEYDAQGKDVAIVDGWIKALTKHLQETDDLVQQQLQAAMQAMEQQAAQQDQQPQPGKSGKSAKTGAPPPDSSRIKSGIQSNASGGPNGAVAH